VPRDWRGAGPEIIEDLEVGAGDLHLGEDTVGMIQELHPRSREFHAAPEAVEEANLEFVFQ
jgi:hypothetical protein